MPKGRERGGGGTTARLLVEGLLTRLIPSYHAVSWGIRGAMGLPNDYHKYHGYIRTPISFSGPPNVFQNYRKPSKTTTDISKHLQASFGPVNIFQNCRKPSRITTQNSEHLRAFSGPVNVFQNYQKTFKTTQCLPQAFQVLHASSRNIESLPELPNASRSFPGRP